MKGTIYFLSHGNDQPNIIEYDNVDNEDQFMNMLAMGLMIGNEEGTFNDKTFGYFNGVWYHAIPSKEEDNLKSNTCYNAKRLVRAKPTDDDDYKLTHKAVMHGFLTVRDVRIAYCQKNEKYDTCSVCSEWNRVERCTLLRRKETEDCPICSEGGDRQDDCGVCNGKGIIPKGKEVVL